MGTWLRDWETAIGESVRGDSFEPFSDGGPAPQFCQVLSRGSFAKSTDHPGWRRVGGRHPQRKGSDVAGGGEIVKGGGGAIAEGGGSDRRLSPKR